MGVAASSGESTSNTLAALLKTTKPDFVPNQALLFRSTAIVLTFKSGKFPESILVFKAIFRLPLSL